MRKGTRRHIPEDGTLCSHGPGRVTSNGTFFYSPHNYRQKTSVTAIPTRSRRRGALCRYSRRVYIEIQGHYSIWRLSVAASCRRVCRIKVARSSDCPQALCNSCGKWQRMVWVKTRILCEGSCIHSRSQTNDTQNCATEIRLTICINYQLDALIIIYS